jgi:heterotetrameric sarcosine oxidase gamma subunit
MVESLKRAFATDPVGKSNCNTNLNLQECIDYELWSVRQNKKYNLELFSKSVFGRGLETGEMIKTESLRLLRLWPDSAWLISSGQQLPRQVLAFKELITDISHAVCELRLQGEHALSFLNDYCPVDLKQGKIRTAGTVRTIICNFQVTLWWDEISDIRILVDRSYAQSLSLHIQQLFVRWP